MLRLRPLTAVFLALCLALTSLSLAVARVQAPMAQWVELCGTQGRLAVDADGHPVGPVHLCPDCVAAFAAAGLPAAMPVPAVPGGWTRVATDLVAPSQWRVPVVAAPARGPPGQG